jgi:hypothetical protein
MAIDLYRNRVLLRVGYVPYFYFLAEEFTPQNSGTKILRVECSSALRVLSNFLIVLKLKKDNKPVFKVG